MKVLQFLGDSLKRLREFPSDVQRDVGYQLDLVQRGKSPRDFKPMSSVGRGVEEIRIWDESGTYRVIYIARLADTVYVLHTFQKKTQTTAKSDLDIAKTQLAQILKDQR